MSEPEKFRYRWTDIPLIFRMIVHRASYRGGSLLTFAFLDYVIGISLITDTPNTEAYKVIGLFPYPVWAFLWLAVGTVCTIQAFARDNDAYGFLAAASIKFLWSLGFLLAWFEYGAYRAGVASATWLVIGLFVLLISGWPDPGKRRR